MRKILLLCALTVVISSVFTWRTVTRTATFGTFTGAPAASVASVIADPQSYLVKTVQVEGVISEQCKSMGCFFFFKSGKEQLRVDLQDVAMTAPMREGRKARAEGRTVPYNGGYQFFASAVEFE